MAGLWSWSQMFGCEMGCLDKQGLGRFSGEVQMHLLHELLCKVRLVCGRPVG